MGMTAFWRPARRRARDTAASYASTRRCVSRYALRCARVWTRSAASLDVDSRAPLAPLRDGLGVLLRVDDEDVVAGGGETAEADDAYGL